MVGSAASSIHADRGMIIARELRRAVDRVASKASASPLAASAARNSYEATPAASPTTPTGTSMMRRA